MNTVILGENTKAALDAIIKAEGPLTVHVSLDSCGGVVFDLLAVASTLRTRTGC